MQKSKKQKRGKSVYNSFSGSFIKGILSGIISFIIFLAVFSIIILNTDIPSSYFFILVLATSCLSSIICSFVSCVTADKNKLIVGMLSNIMVIIIQFIVLLCFNNTDLSLKTYLMFPIDIAAGFISCVSGSNIKR